MTKHIGHAEGCNNAKCRGNCGVGLSATNALLCCRVRNVGETMRPGDVVLIDDMFMPIGFSTSFGSYYAAQIVTTSMTGKVICKAT